MWGIDWVTGANGGGWTETMQKTIVVQATDDEMTYEIITYSKKS